MPPQESNQNEQIIAHLDSLNRQIARQNNFGRMFVVGICYGIGFFVGSAIIATIALGVFAPYFGQIGWVRTAFTVGTGLVHQYQSNEATSTP